MGSGIQAIDKTNKLLSVMTVCRNVFHNGDITYICYKFMKVLSIKFLWYVQFSMETWWLQPGYYDFITQIFSIT